MTVVAQAPTKLQAPTKPVVTSNYYVVSAASLIVLLVLPLLLSSFNILLLNLVGIYALATLGLVLLTGSGGITSFAQAAFMGIGAYCSAYVTLRLGLNPWLGLVASIVLVGVCSAAMGAATLHLGGHYLPITTLAWAVAVYMLFGTITTLGANSGIGDIPSISIAGLELEKPERSYYLIWAFVILAFVGATNLLGSRQGRAISALRGGVQLAESLGISAFRVRLALFVIAAELAGVAGWLFAHTQHFISPSSFDLSAGMQVLLMSVLGGVGNVLGALVGALFVTLGRNWIQDILPALGLDAGTLEIVVFSAIFILLVHYSPKGLSPLLTSILPAGPRAALAEVRHGDRLQYSRIEPALTRAAPLLRLDGISKRYGRLEVIKELAFDVEPGTILALIGPNGAGKSTTFDLISGLKMPSAGVVSFLGRPIVGTPARELIGKGMSRTFQHVKLRPKSTLIDNVMMGAHWRMKAGPLAGILRLDKVEEAEFRQLALLALKEVGLADEPYALAGNLALGQQRLLEIARTLVSDPILVILDEPAAGLRALEKQSLAALLRHMRAIGVTILLVEHDVDFVMGLADDIVVLDFGRRLAVGKPADIRNNPKVQEAYLGGDA